MLLLALALLLSPLQGALGDDRETLTDNWYEIFVRSFYDSDGDRVGDFNGITAKLDDLSALGVGGIWLMPIHPSPSYHGYDVTDYYDVNPDFGTLADFEALLSAAHARGIRVIIDLVLNHTSNEHPWFQSARFVENSPYREWYNWSDTAKTGYNQGGSAYYESRFVASMPDLNLDNQEVRAEIERIMRYWLELGVDGFRLDAVTSFYTGSAQKNKAFLKWLSATAKGIKPDCFMVGEAWDSLPVIKDYYGSGLDSFFIFPAATKSGWIAKMLNEETDKGVALGDTLALAERELSGYLPAPFLGNHDTARIANAVGYSNATDAKMAIGLLSLFRGSLFVYYGDEIGMIGDGNDPNKRIGFFWDERSTITRVPPGTTKADYPFGSLKEQQANPLSIYNYYKAALNLRKACPAIARGETTVIPQSDPTVCVIEKTFGAEKALLIVNLDIDDKTIPLPTGCEGYTALAGELEVWGTAKLTDGALTLPAYGIALLK